MHQDAALFNRPDFLNNAMNVARLIAAHCVAEGDTAVDATAGNGHDTVMLARAVGETGRVWAFDVQQEALDATWARCAAAAVDGRVELVSDSHAQMERHVPQGVACVVFNLGYLPGGDKSCVTQAASTLKASEAALRLLKVGGSVLWVAYPGHDGGSEERALAQWVKTLDQKVYNVFVWRPLNQAGDPPVLFGAQRRA